MGESNGNETTAGPTDLDKKIIYQIEYYFGDINLPKDKFLQEKIKEDDGFVPLEVLLTFNRLKELSPDSEVIAAAIKKSDSGLIEVSEDNKKIRRSLEKPLPENTKERRDELSARTVYCKGFPEDGTFDPIKSFLENYGPLDSLYLRRIAEKFKGSVFVTFKTVADAEKFINAESIKYGDTELIKLNKNDYYKKKTEEKRKFKLEKEEALKAETAKEFEEQMENIKDRITKGAILNLEGFGEGISREDVRNFFEDFAKVSWVDYNPGEPKGQVRFSEENQAQVGLDKAKEANGGKIEINGTVLEGRVFEGEEELDHWKMIFNERIERNKTRNAFNKRGGGRGRGRGKFGSYKGKRKGRNEEDQPSAKVLKTE